MIILDYDMPATCEKCPIYHGKCKAYTEHHPLDLVTYRPKGCILHDPEEENKKEEIS